MTIYTGDCLEVMRTLPSESVDSVVTDPPAGIAFMSKSWDKDKGGRTQWVAWMTEVMAECYRLLKPGGYAVVWSLPRTCHWTGWAMEDAGFIIRDQLAHIFASGFPKGRAQLKPAREDWWLARKPGPLRPLAIDECRIVNGDDTTTRHSSSSSYMTQQIGQVQPKQEPYTTGGTSGRWPSNVLLSDPELFDTANPGVVGSGAVTSSNVRDSEDVDAPASTWALGRSGVTLRGHEDSGGYSRFFLIPKADRADREPVLRGQVETVSAGSLPGRADGSLGGPIPQRENAHPTVKPTDLMRHLVRLVTPPGGLCLDPFLGSGTTGLACEMEGFRWIGIEKEPEYVAIAEARLNGVQRGLGLDVPAPTAKRAKSTGHWPKERTPGSEGWGFTGQTGLDERFDKPEEAA